MKKPTRAGLLVAIALTAVFPAGRSPAATTCDDATPLDPETRLSRIRAEAPGTEKTYCLFFGPYTIPSGHDLSRVDIDLALAEGFIVAGGTNAALADGREPSTQQVHVHHAHWWRLDPNAPNYGPPIPIPGWQWIAGAGEEKTNGDFGLVAAADPDPAAPRYGIATHAGDRVLLINMVHNKTPQPWVTWVKVQLRFVHGTAEQIRAAKGLDYHALTPVLVGGTFDVPRGSGHGGVYRYPFDAAGTPRDDIVPGTGRVWKAPFSGSIVIGAAHVHPGGLRTVFTNLGRDGDRCANDRSDGMPGTTLYELDAIDRVAPYSEDFQIEITQPGFRATIHEGDELSLNGIYESAGHAWWAAMTHTGFYVDEHPVASRPCSPRLVGTPPGWSPALPVDAGSYANAIDGVPNRPWTGEPLAVCGEGYGPDCDADLPPEPPGAAAPAVTIAALQYFPGGAGLTGTIGPPKVRRGMPLRFVNGDFFAADIRHTVTSCEEPCDGPYWANYPLPDGVFDSGFLGWEPTTGGGGPVWNLDTSRLAEGRYRYFCRIHPWMRGSFVVV